jgi:hypothetical protein
MGKVVAYSLNVWQTFDIELIDSVDSEDVESFLKGLKIQGESKRFPLDLHKEATWDWECSSVVEHM